MPSVALGGKIFGRDSTGLPWDRDCQGTGQRRLLVGSMSAPALCQPEVPPRMVWLGGWGVPSQWLASLAAEHLPAWSHEVLPPRPEAVAEALQRSPSALAGFSFGAHLLLQAQREIPAGLPVLLLAPFASLVKEDGLGGAVPRANLRAMLRQCRRNPAECLQGFCKLTRMPADLEPETLQEWSPTALEQGLECMLRGAPSPGAVPGSWQGVAGRGDPLLETGRLAEVLPWVRWVQGGHDPGDLLRGARWPHE